MALIILAHLNFSQSIANKTIIEEVKNSDLEVEIRHLHHLYPHFKIDSKLQREFLLEHDTVVFQYPL